MLDDTKLVLSEQKFEEEAEAGVAEEDEAAVGPRQKMRPR